MTKINKTVVTNKKAKAAGDQTNWSKVYSQSDDQIEQNIKSDPDAPELKSKVYIKPGKSKSR